jgi:Yip1 domain
MSDMQVQPPAAPATPQAAGLTQIQRVIYTFTAPSKTFNDIRDHSRSWWMPLIIAALGAYVMYAAITMKIGWAQVAENAVHQSPKAEERLANATPEARATQEKITVMFMQGAFIASPGFVLLFAAVGSLVLWGTINFVFGGKASYGSIFAVWMFATLPTIIKTLLGVVVIYAGTAPESFNIRNFAPTNAAAFLNPADTNKALYSLRSSLDIVSIWSMLLLGIGISIVAGVKRSSGYIAVFGWWAIFVLIGVAYNAVMG